MSFLTSLATLPTKSSARVVVSPGRSNFENGSRHIRAACAEINGRGGSCKNARSQAANGRIDIRHSGRANPGWLTVDLDGLAMQLEGRKQVMQMMALFG